jgi:hypothetical protein
MHHNIHHVRFVSKKKKNSSCEETNIIMNKMPCPVDQFNGVFRVKYCLTEIIKQLEFIFLLPSGCCASELSQHIQGQKSFRYTPVCCSQASSPQISRHTLPACPPPPPGMINSIQQVKDSAIHLSLVHAVCTLDTRQSPHAKLTVPLNWTELRKTLPLGKAR